jgi:V8-like Glu-specific endopeptidase
MNPDLVMEANATEDRGDLLRALNHLAERLLIARERQAALQYGGGVPAGVSVTADPFSFATQLAAALLGRPIEEREDRTHPLLRLIDHCLQVGPENYGLDGDDVTLFERVRDDGRDRTTAVRKRRAVVKIEDQSGGGLGTGVLVGKSLLLTCDHIWSKTGAKQAWARFGYRTRIDGTVASGTRLQIDVGNPIARGGGTRPDYALLEIAGDPGRPALTLADLEVNAGQSIRLIHHPGGKPAAVSDPGGVTQVGENYLFHDVPTEEGSSGAPIFDAVWNLIGLHRGRTDRSPAGQSEGVRVTAFRKELVEHLEP